MTAQEYVRRTSQLAGLRTQIRRLDRTGQIKKRNEACWRYDGLKMELMSEIRKAAP